MRRWFLAIWIGLTAFRPAQAGSASANLAVSVAVVDRCLIHTGSRSASCAGGSPYALGIGRERIAVMPGGLTADGDDAQTTQNGSRPGISRSFVGAGAHRDGDDGAVRTVADATGSVDAIRVTYSF